jgi:prepilin-type N-terminal cleavage/methylation domain-containing protein
MNLSLRSRPRRTAFTLVEMMVAMAVLSLITLALSLVMRFVISTWLAGLNTVDNFTKARSMLNLLDRDIQLMVLRRDLGAFVDQSGNPACAFYANVQGYPGTDTRAVSLLYYANVVSGSSATLQRQNYGMNFQTASGVTPSLGTTNTIAQLANIPANGIENLSTGVVAFRWQFIDGTGTYQTPPTSAAFNYNFINPGASSNYRTVVVSMVVLSNNAYNLAIKTGTLSRLTDGSTDFPTSLPGGNTNQSFATYWNGLLNNPASGSFDPTLPAPIRGPGGILVFERHIPLPVTTPSS